MPVLYSGCGQQVYLPEKECTECDQFEARLEEVENTLPNKQNKLTAGNGINLSGNTISADTNELQEKLATGDWLRISGGDVIDIIRPVTPEVEITASVGAIGDRGYFIRRFGQFVFITMEVINSNAIAAGGNIFEGTIDSPLPIEDVVCGSFWGKYALGTKIGADGSILVRNASSTQMTAPDQTRPVRFTITYVTDE